VTRNPSPKKPDNYLHGLINKSSSKLGKAALKEAVKFFGPDSGWTPEIFSAMVRFAQRERARALREAAAKTSKTCGHCCYEAVTALGRSKGKVFS
jgi:hypothetical protein